MLAQLIIAILGISFLIGFTVSCLCKKDSSAWKIFPGFYTFFPAAIAILVAFFSQKRWSFGDFSYTKFTPLYLFLGFIIPVVLYCISLAVQLKAGSLKLKTNIDWKSVLIGIPVNIVMLIFFVAGEEIGWRGFLQTPLINTFGVVGGLILLGLIWGIWHAPIALRGHNLKSDFWAETFVLYPVMCILYSFPLAFLTIESGSIWPALVFHATNNTIGSIGTLIAEPQNTKRQVLLTLATGSVLLSPFVVMLAF